MFSLFLQLDNTKNIPSTHYSTESAFKKMPDSLMSKIQNCLQTKETVKAHLVCHFWQHLWGSDGNLNLSNSKLTDDDLERIATEYKNSGKLKSINLQNCRYITNAGLAHLAKITSLTRLNLEGCNRIRNDGLRHLAHLPLTELILNKCKITDDDLKHLARLPLTTLHLKNCLSITDDGLKHLARLPLTMLDLSLCFISDAGLSYLAQLPLTRLSLYTCDCITDTGFKYLAQQLPLTKLDRSRRATIQL